MELGAAGAVELAWRIRARDVSPVEVASAVIEKMAALEPKVNAFTYHDSQRLLDRARQLADATAAGQRTGPLHGVPSAVKALTPVAGLPATAGFAPLRDAIAPESAPVVGRLMDAGGLMVGLTNCSELGYAASATNHLFGTTHNPLAPGLTAGGSSGGAAAAVAAGLVALAEGTDGAGSVRIPASCCGVVGFKPSFGRIPLRSPRPGRTHLHHGVLARTVADAAFFFDALSDRRDPPSMPAGEVRLATTVDAPLRRMRVGWSHDLGLVELNPAVRAVFDRALQAIAPHVGVLEDAHPDLNSAKETMWTVWRDFYAPWHAKIDHVEQIGLVDADLLDLIAAGAQLTQEERERANTDRRTLSNRVAEWFATYDILLTPTISVPPFHGSQAWPPDLEAQPLRERLLGWLLTYPFNLASACPAISIPAGSTPTGAPVGMQIVGKPHADLTLLGAARQIELALGSPWESARR